jgi:hypothetical protein
VWSAEYFAPACRTVVGGRPERNAVRRFLDKIVGACTGCWPMGRRALTLRVTFAPTRMSAEYLRAAYDVVLPVVEREVRSTKHLDDEAVVVRSATAKRDRTRGAKR